MRVLSHPRITPTVSGHESIRILNELISDIDELLDIPKYNKHIEKIKTALG